MMTLNQLLSADRELSSTLWIGCDSGALDPFVTAIVGNCSRAGRRVHLVSPLPLPSSLHRAIEGCRLVTQHVLVSGDVPLCWGSAGDDWLQRRLESAVDAASGRVQEGRDLSGSVQEDSGGSLLLLVGVGTLLCWRDSNWLCRVLKSLLLPHSTPSSTPYLTKTHKTPPLVSIGRCTVCLTVCDELLSESDLATLRMYVTNVARVSRVGSRCRAELTVGCSVVLRVEAEIRRSRSRMSREVSVDTETLRLTPLNVAISAVSDKPSSTPSASGGHHQLQQLTSFKLQLSESERKAREQLVLPFIQPQQLSAQSQVADKRAGGRVFYQPDVNDDWDDEDPDDDLDI